MSNRDFRLGRVQPGAAAVMPRLERKPLTSQTPHPLADRNQKALAIDLGRARMGLAVSDPGTRMALPHSVVERKGTRRDIQQLLALLDRLGIELIVMGLPFESEEGAGTHRLARNFALALAIAQPRPVVLVDEADTTTEAHAELRLLGMRAAKRRAEVDKHAAARILDRWLGGMAAEVVTPVP